MKATCTIIVILLSALGFAQEFQVFDNGLIYSETAMQKLGSIVGDKNDEFRKCELQKNYKSLYQTKGMCFDVNFPDRQLLRQELQENIGLEDFLNKYGNGQRQQLKLLTKRQYVDYNGIKVVEVKVEPDGKGLVIKASDWEKSRTGNWIFNFAKKNYVEVAYLSDDFKSIDLPVNYSRMIQYSECMIDTTTRIHPETAERTGMRYSTPKTKKIDRFLKYIREQFLAKNPKYRLKKDYLKFREDTRLFVRAELNREEEFKNQLEKAYLEAREQKSSHAGLEYYVSEYMSKEKALLLKRDRIVVGSCSMDQSPRIHAMEIAQLSAETFNWDIFLRAHLNIMNDKFQRASDGSYAWAARETYFKELESLNIEVIELVLGISFRVRNPAKNHYYGSIGRLGRAIAESSCTDQFRSELLSLMSHDLLDDYNKLIMYYLYDNMEYYMDKSKKKETYKSNIANAAKRLPEYIRPGRK